MVRAALRSKAASLRLKSQVGAPAQSMARDIAVGLPREIARLMDLDLESGALIERWKKAQENAREEAKSAEDVSEEDISLMGVLEMLDWQRKLMVRATLGYVEKVEGFRRKMEGQAEGIEETLNAIEEFEASQKASEGGG